MQDSINLTPAAREHLQKNLAHSPAGTVGVKFGLRDAGCSGFAYTFDFVSQTAADDQTFDLDGVKIIIPAHNFKALKGSLIDLVQEGINSVLKVTNPNVMHECGCGESFQIKDDIK